MAEQWQNEANQRQFTLMEEHISQYEKGCINIGSLIAGLESLLQCLEAIDAFWQNEFYRAWGILEEVHSVALHRIEQDERLRLDMIIIEPNNQRLISEAIECIRRLIADRLASSIND
jgi:hypothetical protein